MSTKNYIIYTVLLLIACVVSWSFLQSLENQPISNVGSDRPDSFMTNVVGTRLNIQGLPQDQMISPMMIHYSAGDTTNITLPHFIIFNSTGEPWDITSKFGQATNGIELLKLWDTVKLHQNSGPKNREITMTTSELTIHPKEQFAETAEPVTVWDLGSVVNAVGMRADLKTGTVILLSQARGKYQPGQ